MQVQSIDHSTGNSTNKVSFKRNQQKVVKAGRKIVNEVLPKENSKFISKIISIVTTISSAIAGLFAVNNLKETNNEVFEKVTMPTLLDDSNSKINHSTKSANPIIQNLEKQMVLPTEFIIKSEYANSTKTPSKKLPILKRDIYYDNNNNIIAETDYDTETGIIESTRVYTKNGYVEKDYDKDGNVAKYQLNTDIGGAVITFDKDGNIENIWNQRVALNGEEKRISVKSSDEIDDSWKWNDSEWFIDGKNKLNIKFKDGNNVYMAKVNPEVGLVNIVDYTKLGELLSTYVDYADELSKAQTIPDELAKMLCNIFED